MNNSLPIILDACCGPRTFWFDREDKRSIFMDCREDKYIVDRGTPGTKGRSPVIVKPQIMADFTEMPFRDEIFYHVVFDPPHYTSKSMTGNSKLAHQYGMLFAGRYIDFQVVFNRNTTFSCSITYITQATLWA